MDNCSGEHYNPHSYSLSPSLLYYGIAIYSPGQQKKFNNSASIGDIELKFWGYTQISLTYFLDQFWLILLAPVIKTVRNKGRDRSEPTKIGYKIPQNGQKVLKFSK